MTGSGVLASRVQNPAYSGSAYFFRTTPIMSLSSVISYLRQGIWHTHCDHPIWKSWLLRVAKVILIAVGDFIDSRIMRKAAALSFSSLLAIVPLLAIVFAIANGLGFSKNIEDWLRDFLSNQPPLVSDYLIDFVKSYLLNVKSGVILGAGVLVMLYSSVMLISGIECTFNDLWHTKASRSWMSTIVNFVAAIVLFPILVIITSGLSLYFSSLSSHLGEIAAPVVRFLLRFVPFVVWTAVFIIIYKVLPFTHVKWRSVIGPGIVAGTTMLLLQRFFIIFQMRATSYGAIYGSFAALPLFMLWLPFSWIICLIGVHLCYINQHLERLTPLQHNDRLAHDYALRLSAMLLSHICKNFSEGGHPLTVKELSIRTGIPSHLVSDLLTDMERVHLVADITGGNRQSPPAYLPAIDNSHLTFGLLVERLESGEEWTLDNVSLDALKGEHWSTAIGIRSRYLNELRRVCVSDLEIS